MSSDPWLPVGYALPDGARTFRVQSSGAEWQIVSTKGGGTALLVTEELGGRWSRLGLIRADDFSQTSFGSIGILVLTTPSDECVCPLEETRTPRSKAEALAFATALRETRHIDDASPLQDAIYVQQLGRLLPTFGITPRLDDDIVLGKWLTGGVHVSVRSARRLEQLLGWLEPRDCVEIVAAAGLIVADESGAAIRTAPLTSRRGARNRQTTIPALRSDCFTLPGRPALETFFNEHVIDIIRHRERYRALGIAFPSAVVLHGPPGCGKTFAIDQVIEFLGWPSFRVEASSVASPYIHDTSRKVAEVFGQAIEQAPSVLVIDEMEAFLADRTLGLGSSHHRVEEVAEFLRRIPEAVQNDVWVVAMTNRIDMIDPAILRRGRFDHVLQVDYASETEIAAMLAASLADVPTEPDLDIPHYASRLTGRPLSDVAFVVREGARLAARSGKDKLDHQSVLDATAVALARGDAGEDSVPRRRIGFSDRT